MALKAGYVGIKNRIKWKINKLASMLPAQIPEDDTLALESEISSVIGLVDDTVGWIGKNLFDKNNSAEVVELYINDNVGKVASSSSAKSCVIPCKPNTTYTISKNAGQRFNVGYLTKYPETGDSVYGIVKNWTGSILTITTGDDATYLMAYVYHASYDSGTAEQMIASVQIEYGSKATAYEPYHASVEDCKADNSVIAPVENGTTASQAYSVGEHFIKDGKFCTVISDIASGGTFTLNTNYVEGTIADNLIKQDTFSGTTTSGGDLIITTDSDRLVLRAETNTSSQIVHLYKREAGGTTGYFTDNRLTALSSTTVSGAYYYIDKH